MSNKIGRAAWNFIKEILAADESIRGDRSALYPKVSGALLVSVWRICLRFAAATQSHLGYCAPAHNTRFLPYVCSCVSIILGCGWFVCVHICQLSSGKRSSNYMCLESGRRVFDPRVLPAACMARTDTHTQGRKSPFSIAIPKEEN